MNFLEREDGISRFLIINLPRFPQRLLSLKLSLHGCANLQELSKKFDTLPPKLLIFKLEAYNIELSESELTFFASNLYRLPKTLTKFSLALEHIVSLDKLTEAIPSLPPTITSFSLIAKSSRFSNEQFEKFSQSIDSQFPRL